MGVVAQAQDTASSGMTARFDISQRLEYSDNPDLEEDGNADFFGRTTLGFGLESQTALETFSFNIGTDIEEFLDDQSSLNLTNQSLRLRYDRATASARIGLGLRYRESDVTSSFFSDDFSLDGNSINQDTGTRQSYGVSVNGAFGQQAPIGASYNLSSDEIKYQGTEDPDLVDQTNDAFSGQVNFRIDPRITARLTASYLDRDFDGDGVNRRTTGYGAGVALDVNPRLVADLSFSQDEVELSGDENRTEDGTSFALSLTQQMPNGTIGLRARSEITSNGRREFFNVSRDMALPRGELSFSAGLTRNENADTNPLFDVTYLHRLPSSSIRLGLSQTVTSNNDNQDVINTSLQAVYSHQINSLSNIDASLSYFDRNELGVGAEDGQRVDLSLTYRHSLTRDWGLVNGVTRRMSSSDSGEDRTSNTFFVGLERSFQWRP